MATHSLEAKIADSVMKRIARRRAIHAGVYGVVTAGGIAGFVSAAAYVVALAQQSGFIEYVSLALSDGGALAASWKQFALSLLESAPIVESIPALGLLVIIGLCAKKLLSDINNLKSYRYARA